MRSLVDDVLPATQEWFRVSYRIVPISDFKIISVKLKIVLMSSRTISKEVFSICSRLTRLKTVVYTFYMGVINRFCF
jgi:hypothetical protein